MRLDLLFSLIFICKTRCVDLLNEFEAKVINKRFLYNTTYLKPSDLDEAFLNKRKILRLNIAS